MDNNHNIYPGIFIPFLLNQLAMSLTVPTNDKCFFCPSSILAKLLHREYDLYKMDNEIINRLLEATRAEIQQAFHIAVATLRSDLFSFTRLANNSGDIIIVDREAKINNSFSVEMKRFFKLEVGDLFYSRLFRIRLGEELLCWVLKVREEVKSLGLEIDEKGNFVLRKVNHLILGS